MPPTPRLQAAPGPFAGPYRDDAPDLSRSDEPAPTMRRRSRRTPAGLARCVLKAAIPALLVLTPLGAIVFLTVAVLWPTAKDPQSKIYSTVIGHPAIQRLLGRPIDIPIAGAAGSHDREARGRGRIGGHAEGGREPGGPGDARSDRGGRGTMGRSRDQVLARLGRARWRTW